VQFAADVGIDTIRVDTVEPVEKLRPMGIPAEEVFDRAAAAFGQCAQIAAKRGVRVTWEFEPHLPLSTPAEIVELVDTVRQQGHANFGVLFDTSHAHVCTAGGELELLQALKGKINHVHLADSDGSVDEQGVSRHLPLGAGRIDFAKLLPELRDAAWWTIDLYNCPEAWDAIASAKKFLSDRRLL
jgi:sugar phosphate isomerase/epimerase